MSVVINSFLNDRKQEWLKKKFLATTSEEQKLQLLQEAQIKYSLATWLPDAARRASQLSMATHPGKFSHPSAKISSIIANSERANDGYLRTGNVNYDLDVFGNAAAMDVYKFLSLTLENGQTVLEHLEIDSPEIKAILTISTAEFKIIRQGFLAVKQNDKTPTTDGLVKQVYFPVENNYHLLSLLTPSGLLFRIKKQLDQMRFSDTAKEAKESRKNKVYHAEGFDDIYDLLVTAYGGTKPQNISVLNNQNVGMSYLLQSSPSILKKREVRLPIRNFFANTLWIGSFKESFHLLHHLIILEFKNPEIKKAIENILKYIIDRVLEHVFKIRAFDKGWSTKDNYKNLPLAQRIWLDDIYNEARENTDEWLDAVCDAFARWIVRAYEKTLKQSQIMFGSAELKNIRDRVNDAIKQEMRFIK